MPKKRKRYELKNDNPEDKEDFIELVHSEELPEKSEELEVEVEPKEEYSPKKSEELEVEIEQPDEEEASEKSEELEVKVKKLKDKLKLISLELERKSADLEIKIGKADERFKEVAYDFPELKEKAEEMENSLGVINLGLTDFKKRFTDIDSRMSNLEKMPGSVERRIVGLDNKLKKIDEDIKKLYLRLGEISTIKQDLTKSLEDKIALSSDSIRKEIIDNKAEIENAKKNLDAFSLAIKSFEKTVELTNLDDIIRRFDTIDGKILNIQTGLDKLGSSVRVASTAGEDVEILKKRFKELISTVMSALSKINEIEVRMNSKLAKVEALEKAALDLNTIKSLSDTVIEQVKKMTEIKTSMEDLYEKVMKIYDSDKVSRDQLQNIARELSELNKLKRDLQVVRRVVEENRSVIESLWGEEYR